MNQCDSINQSLAPIGPDADVCKILTCVPEKFLVDFANGIDVTRDHLRVQRRREGLFHRLSDGLTGNSSRRQGEINASLTDGVESSLKWLCELSESLAHSNLAIVKVNERVTALAGNVSELAHYSADTRRQLSHLAEWTDARSRNLEQEVERIGFVQAVTLNLDQVFDKWAAGRFDELSPAGRCYAALEELRWGAFGDYCRAHAGHQRDGFVQQAKHRATAQLSDDVRTSASSRLDTRAWMALPSGQHSNDDMVQALAYLADGYDIEAAPFVTTIARMPQSFPSSVPHLSNATRIAEAVMDEVFMETSSV